MWLIIIAPIVVILCCILFCNVSAIFAVNKQIFAVAKFLFFHANIQVCFENPGIYLHIRFAGLDKRIKLKILRDKQKHSQNKSTKSSSNIIFVVLKCVKFKSIDIKLETPDAANTAMCTGYLYIILNTLAAAFYENFKKVKFSVFPEFSGNDKFEFSCIIYVKPAHIIFEYIKKRGRKHASYRKFVANDYERT